MSTFFIAYFVFFLYKMNLLALFLKNNTIYTSKEASVPLSPLNQSTCLIFI